VVRPSAAKTPHREAERARRGAIHRPPAQIPRAKPKKISATIQNGAFFSSLLGVKSPFDRLRAGPFDRLGAGPFDKLRAGPLDGLGAGSLDALGGGATPAK
jgi:hypothetical protein